VTACVVFVTEVLCHL